MHIWLTDMFRNNRNSKLPYVDLLVIRSRHKTTAVFDESDSIDASKMLFVLLDGFLLINVILEDLLVRAACEEDVLFIIVWVELYALGVLFVLVRTNDLARLRVPEVNILIEAGTKELLSVICEADVSYSLVMAHIGPDAALMCHDIPDLARAVVACAQKKVTCLWEKFDSLHPFFMSLPGVDPFLRNEAVVLFVAQV